MVGTALRPAAKRNRGGAVVAQSERAARHRIRPVATGPDPERG